MSLIGGWDGLSARSDATAQSTAARKPGLLARWWRRRRARRRNIDHAVWELRERYGEAAYRIARASSRQPVGFERRRFWHKVAVKLQQLG